MASSYVFESFYLGDYENSDYESSDYANANANANANVNANVSSHETEATSFNAISWSWNLTAVLIMAVFGIAGNAALLMVIVLNRHLRTMSNILVANLAVADLIMFVLALPSDIAHWILTNWPETGAGNALCKLSGGTWVLAQVLCVTSLTAVSIERYCSLRRQIQLKRTKSMLVVVWVISLLCTVPVLVWATVIRLSAEHSLCHILPLWNNVTAKAYLTTSFVITYLLPLVLITSCYMGMASILAQGGAGATTEVVRAKRRLTIVILVLNISFAVGWLPSHVVNLFFLYASHEVIFSIPLSVYIIVVEVSHVLAYLTSCLNPVVVFAISVKHRRPLVHFIFCHMFRQTRPAVTDQNPSDRYARVPEDVVSETEYADDEA